jgi:hypothetical protein
MKKRLYLSFCFSSSRCSDSLPERCTWYAPPRTDSLVQGLIFLLMEVNKSVSSQGTLSSYQILPRITLLFGTPSVLLRNQNKQPVDDSKFKVSGTQICRLPRHSSVSSGCSL